MCTINPDSAFLQNANDSSFLFPAPSIIGEQRHPSIARKRQFVQVTRFMKVSNPLSMSGHAFIPVDESRDLHDSQKNKCNQRALYANPLAIQDIATEVCCVWHGHRHWRSKAIASGTSGTHKNAQIALIP